MFADKVLTCKECNREFPFTASEQEFYAEKGFTNEPGRCPECRAARKTQARANRRGGLSGDTRREMYPATCSACGQPTSLPFQPTGDKPVYCRECFQQTRRNNW